MHFDLKNVTVQFDEIPALFDVSCKIADGASLLLTGPTGAGKTTLLKLLYADVLPTQGEVFIAGQKTSALAPKRMRELRRKMGIMFQDAKLMPSLTVYENVLYPLIIAGYSKREANKRGLEVLADIGVSYVRDKFPRQLSGGEKHLVGLARAIINKPECIIADEPTGNVDSETADKIATILKRENTRGATVIIATHDPYLAEHFINGPRLCLYEGTVVGIEKQEL
ncbi:MAG: ATP-binding cassette domain-containing protein [Candidatus Kapabacteria bacterium]|nr:ATP-binding cassette domain-containing protein [Candidatus Kapabacteria bacterium]MBX7156303.1 ATP-binding cassette domain-containing protein [Bacteroidota bacterium]